MEHEEAKELLFEGARNGNLDLVKEGIIIVKDVNIKDEYGDTPLHIASMNRYLEMVKFLISKGAEVNSKNIWGGHLYNLHQNMDI